MQNLKITKYTPGPWKVQPGEINIGPYNKGLMVGPLQYAKVHVVGPFETPIDDETRANARLIAAAPELLEALKALRFACQHMIGSFDADDIAAFESASRAIGKATEIP